MKRRLRKKLHHGEFDYKCFEVECEFSAPMELAAIEKLFDEFVEFAERGDLGIGGGFGPEKMCCYVTKSVPCHRKSDGKTHYKGSHCTDGDRAKVEEWIRSKLPVGKLTIGPLEGGWHRTR